MHPDRLWVDALRCEHTAPVRQVDRSHAVGNREKILQHERTCVAPAPLVFSVPATATDISLAGCSAPKPNWMRQRNTMLVERSWRRHTAATLTPGASDSMTIASFCSSLKLRLFDRRSYCGPAVGGPVNSVSTVRFLAALLTPLLIFGRALG